MVTTQEKFDYISNRVQVHIGALDAMHGIFGPSLNPCLDDNCAQLVRRAEVAASIQEDLVKKLDQEAAQAETERYAAQHELERELEYVRTRKLRERTTSTGMSLGDFVRWAEARTIHRGKTLVSDVCIRGVFMGPFLVCGSLSSGDEITLDTSKTWRIAQ